MSEQTGADKELVGLFAILHDCRRENEGWDSDHGRRAASFASHLREKAFQIEADRFALLEKAIALHADGELSGDPTIGTCWDADRLDLPRVGVLPTPDFLSTDAAIERLRLMDGRPAGRDVLESFGNTKGRK